MNICLRWLCPNELHYKEGMLLIRCSGDANFLWVPFIWVAFLLTPPSVSKLAFLFPRLAQRTEGSEVVYAWILNGRNGCLVTWLGKSSANVLQQVAAFPWERGKANAKLALVLIVQFCVCFLIQTLRLKAMNLLTEGTGAGAQSLAWWVWASSGDGTRAAVSKELVAAPGESGTNKYGVYVSMKFRSRSPQDNTGMSPETPLEHESWLCAGEAFDKQKHPLFHSRSTNGLLR